MKYQVLILRRAQKELQDLPDKEYERARDATWSLAEQPRPHGCCKLVGRDGWRIRVGNYIVSSMKSTMRKTLSPYFMLDITVTFMTDR
jgi:mRNA interferase RelE/StbE